LGWVLARLAELMFVEVVRQYITRLPDDSKGWLSGLNRHVGHALRLIHGEPEKPWTLAELAREVGLSRSVFADRFTHYVGVSPMHYLGRWRMWTPGPQPSPQAPRVGLFYLK
jgi:transcriptional regulator GlxA family with amidase domain